MKLVEECWAVATSILNLLTFSPFRYDGGNQVQQVPIFRENLPKGRGPIFKPPGRLRGDPVKFECNYTAMKGWRNCSTPGDRTCWLENPTKKLKFDINTDYETQAPIGITRYYTFNVSYAKKPLNLDGEDFVGGMVFNGDYPGPWIQACWGDTVEITVNVDKEFDMGTSVHWHGIRQLNTTHMDGVPGITQCPIPPGGQFVYRWKALQYGSSWYHSHYSLQYADGLLGPMTIHGPSTSSYDEAPAEPLFISDWNHISAVKDHDGKLNQTVLLGGVGNVTKCYPGAIGKNVPKPFTLNFVKGKKYLLRVINVAYDSTFLFSIDNHNFTVVSADFVHIKPYQTDSIVVGIGQRYNIIVEANPGDSNSTDFWIRTYVVAGKNCYTSAPPPGKEEYMKTGIIRYDNSSTAEPTSTEWPKLDYTYCRDEPKFTPVVPWNPGAKANPNELLRMVNFGQATYPGFSAFQTPPEKAAGQFLPLRVDWQNVTFLNLDNKGGWNNSFVILPEDYKATDWVYLVITNPGGEGHPIHLHGHDFAIIEQVANKPFSASQRINAVSNPPRRDVVFLPERGYLVIAFKADNPGPWLVHCHIAAHASGGLAMQILEDREAAAALWPPTSEQWKTAKELCTAWTDWCAPRGGCNNTHFQDDSGI